MSRIRPSRSVARHTVTLALGLLAAPAAAASSYPDIECLRADLAVLRENPELRRELAISGQLGAVIAAHLDPAVNDQFPWCAD